jgi:polyisoprenoid-binding protein YceI
MATVVESSERAVNGVAFPAAGTWVLDPAHTSVEFQVKHLMVAKVRGHFAGAQGALVIAEDPAESTAAITIDASTINTGVADRDAHLKSPDFLEVDAYPEIVFTSTGLEHDGGSDWKLHGELTIHGETRPATLDVEYNGVAQDPWGGTRAVFSAETKIDREQWGLTWNQALEAGGWLVGRDIKIALEVEAVRHEG